MKANTAKLVGIISICCPSIQMYKPELLWLPVRIHTYIQKAVNLQQDIFQFLKENSRNKNLFQRTKNTTFEGKGKNNKKTNSIIKRRIGKKNRE